MNDRWAFLRVRTLSLLLVASASLSCSITPKEQALEDIRDTTIIPNLGSYDEQVQKEAVARMLSILDNAPEVGKTLLVASLADPVQDERTKVVCAWLLSTVGDRRALPTLMDLLGKGSSSSESLVREAVVSYGASVVSAVARVLEDGNDLARIAAAEALIELDVSEGIDALAARYSREPQSRVRFLILCGLAADPRRSVINPLERALEDSAPMNRDLVWDALVRRLTIPTTIDFNPEGTDAIREQQLKVYREWRALPRR